MISVEQLHAISPAQHVVVYLSRLSAVGLVVAESPACLSFGFVARESFALHQLFDAPFEVKAQLVVEGAIGGPAASGNSEDAFHRVPPAPAAKPRASSTRPTTPVYRVHRACSAARCFRPVVVRR